MLDDAVRRVLGRRSVTVPLDRGLELTVVLTEAL